MAFAAGPHSTSVLGQKRRFDLLLATSGLPRSTDLIKPVPLVRLVPKGDILAWHDTDEATK